MKLDKIETPFDKNWNKAYLIINRENRKMVCLYKNDTTRKTISYARYLMSVKLGRELTDEETVDHIDNDKTNDSLDNLQILTYKENIAKYQETQPHNIHGTRSMYRKGCRCALCKKWNHDYRKDYIKRNPEKYKKYIQNRKKDIEKACKYCGKTFFVDTSHKNNIFCSKSCSNYFRHNKTI